MKKIFIVDDEFIVRIGLSGNIPWGENGFVVVGVAKNGEEAIEKIKVSMPDILITDIQMPLVNGFDLIESAIKFNKNMRTIIITHHEDFSYAKEAIKLGVYDYILKTDLTPELLLNTIIKLSYVMDSNQHKSLPETGAKFNNSAHVEYFLTELTKNRLITPEEIKTYINNNKTKFNYSHFFMMASSIEKSEEDDKKRLEGSIALFKKRFQEMTDEIFSENDIKLVGYYFLNDKLVALFNIDKSENEKLQSAHIYSIADKLKKNILKFINVELSIGISQVGGLSEVNKLYAQANQSEKDCYFETSKIVVFSSTKVINSDCPKLDFDTLINMIRFDGAQQITEYITKVFDQLRYIRSHDFLYDVFIEFLSFAKIISKEFHVDEDNITKKFKPDYNIIEELHDINVVEKYVVDIYSELVFSIRGMGNGGYSFAIDNCKKYIRNNYMDTITLQDAADYVQLSKSYLSFLFKQETGVNFTTYLKKYRIEKSKILLRETNMKMYEVAEKVGLDNPYYFSKLFKEVAGVSCRDYKKRIR